MNPSNSPLPIDVLNSALIDLANRRYSADAKGVAVWQAMIGQEFVDNLSPNDFVDLAVEVRIDLQAGPESQYSNDAGRKVKPAGATELGLVMTLPDRVVVLWTKGLRVSRLETHSVHIPYSTITAVNDLTWRYRLGSKPGIEIMAEKRWGLLLGGEREEEKWRRILHKRLDGTWFPLFKGFECVRWVPARRRTRLRLVTAKNGQCHACNSDCGHRRESQGGDSNGTVRRSASGGPGQSAERDARQQPS